MRNQAIIRSKKCIVVHILVPKNVFGMELTYEARHTGVTSDLIKRIYEHRQTLFSGFTARYGCKNLVYYEFLGDMFLAIEREKQIKAGSRQKKLELIESLNPEWQDLYAALL